MLEKSPEKIREVAERMEKCCFLPNVCRQSLLRGKAENRGSQGQHRGSGVRGGRPRRILASSLRLGLRLGREEGRAVGLV